MSDQELLSRFRDGSQEAFTEVVSRHLDWVYSSALRQVRDRHLAEDVAQSVFLILSRKAEAAERSGNLGAWLFKTTRYVCLEVLRASRRRAHHERQAAEMVIASQENQGDRESSGDWQQLGPVLDEMMWRLRRKDREALQLRFYERRTFPEVGAQLGISEEAARKRVDRAIEKLRGNMQRRGVSLAAAAIVVCMTKHAAEAAPVNAGAISAGAIQSTTQHAAIAHASMRAMKMAQLKVAGSFAVAASVLIVVGWGLFGSGDSSPQKSDAPSAPPRPWSAEKSPAPAGYPIAAGWPMALPGHITCTPVVADLEGNGKLAVIVPCQRLHQGNPSSVPIQTTLPIAHSNPTDSVLLFAFHADGTSVPGWPVELVNAFTRQNKEETGRYTECWSSSPSVCKDAAGHTRIVMTTPYFLGVRVIEGDGTMRAHHGGSQWANLPLVDMDGDGVPDIISGAALMNIDGKPIDAWLMGKHPLSRISGFAPCIGDTNGDVHLQAFHLFVADKDWNNEQAEIVGYDTSGDELPKWRNKVDLNQHIPYAPAMGDVSGDGKMEIVGNYKNIHVWTADGKSAPGTHDEGAISGILKKDISWGACSPTLADLDGDGKAEIIVYDHEDHTLRAWHGDGKAMGANDGVIATLPDSAFVNSARIGGFDQIPWGGVSVADLGGDGVMDLFVGIYWIKFDPRTAKSTVTAMAPEDATMNGSQPTICDLDGDGKADVVFGLTDGRVFVYRTEMGYRQEWMQWPTANGNFQHTGVWKTPSR